MSTSSTNPFKKASDVQTKRAPASSVTAGLEGTSDVNEARYWTQKLGLGNTSNTRISKRKFAHPRSVTVNPSDAMMVQQVLFGPPAFTKSPPLAVVSGPRVSLYGTTPSSALHRALHRHSSISAITTNAFGSNTVEADRQVQTGGNLAYCASFRSDGRLIAVGTNEGQVRVCDATMRATLATFVADSRLATRSVQWLRNGQQLLSGGDDGVARIWDLSSLDKRKPLIALTGHGDAIRSTLLWQNKTDASSSSLSSFQNIAFTGSYDHSIRVWNLDNLPAGGSDASSSGRDDDEETNHRCLAVLSHGAPVEAMCLQTSEDPNVPVWLLSAGGTVIKVWNPLTGKCVATVSTQHRKTITSLLGVPRINLDNENDKEKIVQWRILTSSLDGLLEFHSWNAETGDIGHLYSTKVGDSITSVVMDEQGDRIAIGTVSGQAIIKMRGPSIEQHKRRREPKAGTYSFFQRGMNAEADVNDYLVTTQGKKRKLRSFDEALKQFRYGDALDDALATRRPRDVIAVLEELGRRRGLTPALSNRDEELLEPILSFTVRYINRPHFTSLLVGIAHRLIDIYGDVSGQSETIDELFVKLKTQISNECNAQKSLLRIVGQIDAIMAAGDIE